MFLLMEHLMSHVKFFQIRPVTWSVRSCCTRVLIFKTLFKVELKGFKTHWFIYTGGDLSLSVQDSD